MGYRPGSPDIIILEPRGPFHGLMVELKAIKGTVSENQKNFHLEAIHRLYKTIIGFGLEDAQLKIKSYLDTK